MIDWLMDNTGIILIIIFVFLFGYALWSESKDPKFTLNKVDWECARSHLETYSSFIMAGKVMVPKTNTRTVCDQYNRVK